MKASTLWPVSVAGVLFVTVAANVVMLVLAGDPHASAVEPDYYGKALAFDSTRAEAARSATLAWQADLTLARNDDGARVHLTLTDRDGRPVDSAEVHVVAIHNLQADHRPDVTLRGEGGGAYTATMPLRRAGLWELRVAAQRGPDRFECDLRRELR
jgi:nitrogen fixation protein FixH